LTPDRVAFSFLPLKNGEIILSCYLPYNSFRFRTDFLQKKKSIAPFSSTILHFFFFFFFVSIFFLYDFFDEVYVPGQACMDTVVNPPQPGEPSYETWKAEVDTTIASLKRSGILPACSRVSHNYTFSSILMGAQVFPIPSCPLRPNIA
jgi:hypothetical protein